MPSQFISLDTKIKDMTEDLYYKVFSDCREHGYSEETIHSINATFLKLVELAYKKGLVSTNFLHKTDNIKTKRKDEKPIRLDGTKATEHGHLRGMRLNITKSMLTDGTIKDPKNFKNELCH